MLENGIKLEVRCPAFRKHSIKGVEYEICGNLLGAIYIGSRALFRCPTCGLVEVIAEDDRYITAKVIGKERVEMEKPFKRVV